MSAPELTPDAIELASKLFDKARAGDGAALKQYIEQGIPVNMLTRDGNSFIMLAAYHGHVDCVKTLLDLGADPNILNERGQSTLAGTAFKGYYDVAKVLMDSGKADPLAGTPNAIETAETFKRDNFLALFK